MSEGEEFIRSQAIDYYNCLWVFVIAVGAIGLIFI